MGLGQLQQWVPPGAAPPPPGMHYVVTEWSAAGNVFDPTTGSTHTGGVPIKWELVPDSDKPEASPPDGAPSPVGDTLGSIPWWGWLAGGAAALYFLTQKR